MGLWLFAPPGHAAPRVGLPAAARAAYAKALSCYDELAFDCAVTQGRRALSLLGDPAPAGLRAAFIELQAFLGEALVAVGRRDEGRAAFGRILLLQPDYAPRAGLSPRIREVFLEAREVFLRERPGVAPVATATAAPPTTPLSLEAGYAYAFLFGDDGASYHHGSAGVFALAYALTPSFALATDVHYGVFTRRSLTQSRLELVSAAVGARQDLALWGRVRLRFGLGVGIASFGVRALSDTTAFALHATALLGIALARTVDLNVGGALGLVANPNVGASVYVPLRLGLAFHF